MKKTLLKLANWLQKYAQQEAKEIKDLSEYDEPWHEEAVKEFGGEPVSEEEYIQQNFETYPTSDIVTEILKENSFKILINKTTDLGSGAYGEVWRGVYQGRPAAAKVILKKYGFGEARAWQKIMNASKNFPPDLKKHLPQIYLTKSGELENQKYELIIMEELKPLSANLNEILERRSGDAYEKNMENLLKDEEYVYHIANRLLEEIDRSTFKYKMHKLKANEVFELVLGSLNYDTYTRNELAHEISKKLGKNYNLDDDEINELARLFFRATDQIFYPSGMPDNKEELEEDPAWLKMPETNKYYEMLQTLSHYNINFNDQHGGNIMMGNDDNLKLIDVGAFDVP